MNNVFGSLCELNESSVNVYAICSHSDSPKGVGMLQHNEENEMIVHQLTCPELGLFGLRPVVVCNHSTNATSLHLC